MIDSHHHFWKYSQQEYSWMDAEALASLRQDRLPDDIKPLIDAAGVTGVVSVQARQKEEETSWLLGFAEQHDFIQGVVGWVPFAAPNVDESIERFAQNPWLKGFRHVVQDEPDDDFILGDAFNRGVAMLKDTGIVYDILIFERHLANAIQFVDRHPNLRFVLDHIAKPKIGENVLEPWSAHMHEMAKRENVYCKLSGMATEADFLLWSEAQLDPYFDVVLDAFGPNRLMFGSDWPVCTLAVDYQRWVDIVLKKIGSLSQDEQERIKSGTAIEAYSLGN